MMVGGWGLFATRQSDRRSSPVFLRPLSNALFGVGALLHWLVTRERQSRGRDPDRRVAVSSR